MGPGVAGNPHSTTTHSLGDVCTLEMQAGIDTGAQAPPEDHAGLEKEGPQAAATTLGQGPGLTPSPLVVT